MEDFEKMQRREGQRQKLLEELRELILRKMEEFQIAEETGIKELFFWHGVIAEAIHYVHNIYTVGTRLSAPAAVRIFRDNVAPLIGEFTPIAAERKLLATGILEFAVAEISRPVKNEIIELSVPPMRAKYLKDIGLDTLEN